MQTFFSKCIMLPYDITLLAVQVLKEACVFHHPSLLVPVAENWLVGGNWQVNKLGINSVRHHIFNHGFTY